MIEGYDDIVKQWTAPSIGHGCCNTVTISPQEEMDRWAVQQTITLLANSDYYYTKAEVDSLLKQIKPGMTPEEVQAMIDATIAEKVYTKEQTNSLLALYLTKAEANGMFANYSKVENTTLVLNADNITN